MAATYRAVATAVPFNASARSLLKVFNASGSGKVLRIYRIWVLNNQTAAITGVLPSVQIVRITAASGGTTVTPMKHDPNSAALPAQITAAHSDTSISVDATFRRFLWSSDEPAVSTMTIDEWETIVPINLVWDSGYNDSTVEPITIRETYGISVYNPGIASAAGTADIIIEFTAADS